jgi:polysaccharide deacetylase family protein (PEP-CTERM system associated)
MKQHILTILVEDYFHVGAFEKLIQQRQWSRFEPRYVQNTLKTLDLLDRFDTKGTFFVLGWIAEQSPDLIKEIVNRGHEAASRGFYYRGLQQMTPEEFRTDLKRTRDALEKAGGREIFGHRAAQKLSFSHDLWTLDVLAEEGFEYDASFLPTKQNIKNERFRRFAHQYKADTKIVWELPYTTAQIGNYLFPISGGNYFRQIPYTLVRHAVRKWHETIDSPFVLYFHVWELDPEQPRINAASAYNRIRHYRKLDKMQWILEENFRQYQFTSAAEYLVLKKTVIENQTTELQTWSGAWDDTLSPDNREVGQIPVTIVIPCYNEEPILQYLANTLKSLEQLLNTRYKINFIFVDDASRDRTYQKLQELFGEKENVKILQHQQNKGVAAGILNGLRTAETEIVCSMDCDCTYDPHELINMIPLLSEDVSLVTASPYHPEGGVRNVPQWRLGLSKGASWLYRRILRAKLYTYTSCFRVYRKSAFESMEISENGFLGVAEMLGKLDLSGGKIVEYPAVLEVRLFGFSKMKTLRTIFGHLKLLSKLTKLRLTNKSQTLANTNLIPAQNPVKDETVSH